MHENPTTRIVPQRGNEIIHYSRPSSRMSSVRLPASSAASSSHWDSKSIATQTSDDENSEPRKFRQPKWKRSSRSRKSIAVMETNRETGQLLNRIRSSSYSTSNLPPPPPQNSKIRGSSSVENFLDDDEKTFLQKYQQFHSCFQNQCAHFTLHDNFMMFYYYQCYAHFASILLFQSIKVHFQSGKSQESSSIFSSYPLRYG